MGLGVLLCLRLSAIEAHCWAHVSAARVPRPLQPSLPDVVEADVARSCASFKFRQAGHRLYKYRSGYGCTRCQRWRTASKSAFWASHPCRAAPQSIPSGSETPGVKVEDEMGRAVAQRARVSDLDDEDGSPVFPFDEDLQAGQPGTGFDEPPECEGASSSAEVSRPRDEDFVSPTEAKRLRRSYRSERDQRQALNKTTNEVALHSEVAAEAADNFENESLEVAVDVELRRGAPNWAFKGHRSHAYLGMGGFVVCGRCGSLASKDITKSGLMRQCKKTCTVELAKSLRQLAAGKFPYHHSQWPDGGSDITNGVGLHTLLFYS